MRRARFSGEQISAEQLRMGCVLRFVFVENEKPYRRFNLSDTDDGGLFIRYSAHDLILDFAQQPGGRVRLVIVADGEPEVCSSNNYVELAKANDRQVRGIMLPLLKSIGVNTPTLSN